MNSGPGRCRSAWKMSLEFIPFSFSYLTWWNRRHSIGDNCLVYSYLVSFSLIGEGRPCKSSDSNGQSASSFLPLFFPAKWLFFSLSINVGNGRVGDKARRMVMFRPSHTVSWLLFEPQINMSFSTTATTTTVDLPWHVTEDNLRLKNFCFPYDKSQNY